jgi:hypothetical protein
MAEHRKGDGDHRRLEEQTWLPADTGISRNAGGLTEGTALAIAFQVAGSKGCYRQLRSFDALPNLWRASFR